MFSVSDLLANWAAEHNDSVSMVSLWEHQVSTLNPEVIWKYNVTLPPTGHTIPSTQTYSSHSILLCVTVRHCSTWRMPVLNCYTEYKEGRNSNSTRGSMSTSCTHLCFVLWLQLKVLLIIISNVYCSSMYYHFHVLDISWIVLVWSNSLSEQTTFSIILSPSNKTRLKVSQQNFEIKVPN